MEMFSTDAPCGMAMGIPPGNPMPAAMLSMRDVSGWRSEKETSLPAPADSKPSGIEEGGEGWIVLLVCWGVWLWLGLTDGMGETGYVGAEYMVEVQGVILGVDWVGVKAPVMTSQSQSAMPLGTVSTAVWGE
jgi:hypothetical protein